jgi:hypothetical protein
MWMLLFVGFIVPFIYFGYLLSKLDRFLAENSAVIEDENQGTAAIVFGETDLANQTEELFKRDKVRVLCLSEPFLLKQEPGFRYLLALSDNDADNLVLSKIGREVYGIENMIAICNERKNEGMFISEKIRYLSNREVTAGMLYQIVVQKTEAKL